MILFSFFVCAGLEVPDGAVLRNKGGRLHLKSVSPPPDMEGVASGRDPSRSHQRRYMVPVITHDVVQDEERYILCVCIDVMGGSTQTCNQIHTSILIVAMSVCT